MDIILMQVSDKVVLDLFSEYDDYMIDFLGKDKKYYTRYNENEKIEKVWVVSFGSYPIGCIAYRSKLNEAGEVKRLFIRDGYRGQGISKKLLKTVEYYAKEQGYEIVNPKYQTKSFMYGILVDSKYAFITVSLEPVDSTVQILKSQLLFVSLVVLSLSLLVI